MMTVPVGHTCPNKFVYNFERLFLGFVSIRFDSVMGIELFDFLLFSVISLNCLELLTVTGD